MAGAGAGVAEWVGENPLRVAGAAGALVALAVMVSSLGVRMESSAGRTAITGATMADALSFSVAHPAYPVAVLVGLGVFLFWRG